MSNEEFVIFIKKNWISVGCAVLSILIGLVIYYRSDELPQAEVVLAAKAQQGALLAANIEDSAQLKEQHAAIVASNAVIADRMIRVGQLAENLQYFYRLESETATKLNDPHQNPWAPPLKNAAKTNFTLVNFSISAQGDYPQVLDLLRRLEDGEHYGRVNACNIHPVVTTLRGGPVVMTLSLDLMAIE
jgi:hypothetical protein